MGLEGDTHGRKGALFCMDQIAWLYQEEFTLAFHDVHAVEGGSRARYLRSEAFPRLPDARVSDKEKCADSFWRSRREYKRMTKHSDYGNLN
jgi:hypothetical protein